MITVSEKCKTCKIWLKEEERQKRTIKEYKKICQEYVEEKFGLKVCWR